MDYKVKEAKTEPTDMGYKNDGMYSNSFLDKPPIKDKPAQ